MLFFGEMSTFIECIRLPETLFPRSDTDDTGAAVMVTSAYKRMEIILAAIGRRVLHCLPAMSYIFPKHLICEMKPLSVPCSWQIYSVEQRRHARNQGKKCKYTSEIKGGIECR